MSFLKVSDPSPAPVRKANGALKTRVEVVLAVVEGAKQIKKGTEQLYRQHFQFTVSVAETDSLYLEVHKWLVNVLPDEKSRSLEVVSSKAYNHNAVVEPEDSDTGKIKPLVVKFNDANLRKLKINGYTVGVVIVKPEGNNDLRREPDPKKIEFITHSYAAQQAVIAKLEEINQQRGTTRKAVLKMLGQWGEWVTRSDLPPRTMDSVSLPALQKKRIVKDLEEFLDAEEQYNRLAIPWHRGYMFHGPPGTGKTSLVKALANEFNLDLWYVSLADLKTEASLISLLARVGPRSLLLLEDIDTMKITHDRDGAQQGSISMSSLLNTLDGVATPHGLISVMTTNNFDILDEALTRPGRMDLVEMIDYPTIDTISQMYQHFYGKTPNFKKFGSYSTPLKGVSTSTIAEIMKRNMTDSLGAQRDISKVLEKKRATK